MKLCHLQQIGSNQKTLNIQTNKPGTERQILYILNHLGPKKAGLQKEWNRGWEQEQWEIRYQL